MQLAFARRSRSRNYKLGVVGKGVAVCLLNPMVKTIARSDFQTYKLFSYQVSLLKTMRHTGTMEV